MKRVYDELSESGPITQEDVKYFKKQAIWRQMNYYKKKYQISEKLLQFKSGNNEGSDEGKSEPDGEEAKTAVMENERDKLIKEIEELNHLLIQQDRKESDSLKRINQVKDETKPEEVEIKPDDDKIKQLQQVIQDYEAKLKQTIEHQPNTTEKVVDVVKLEIIKDFKLPDNEALTKFNQAKYLQFSNLINDVYKNEIEELKNLLTKNEKDLVRIRNIRDELIQKLNSYETTKTNEELLKINQDLLNKINFSNEASSDNATNEIIKELEDSYKKLIGDINIKLINKLDQDNLIKKYQIEKNKADQKYFQIMKTKDTLTNENKILKLNIAKLNEIITTKNDIEASLTNKTVKIEEVNKEFQKIINNLNINNNKLIQIDQSKDKEISKLITKIETLVKEINNLKTNEQDLKKQLSLKDLEVIKYKNSRGVTSGNNAGNYDSNDELNGFRSMVKCSVCSKNWKNMAITVCGHVFCNECVKERLNARLRRCPSCNKGFSANDLLNIHL